MQTIITQLSHSSSSSINSNSSLLVVLFLTTADCDVHRRSTTVMRTLVRDIAVVTTVELTETNNTPAAFFAADD